MKCSHGLDYEVKCSQCFEDAMKRVSFSQGTVQKVLEESEAAAQLFLLGHIQMGIDTNPRPL